MANFCANCGAAVDPDAKFCPSCRARVSITGALSSELRSEMQARLRAVTAAPAMRVPPAIWAGVIEVFWIFLGLVFALIYSTLAGGSLAASGVAFLFGDRGGAEDVAVWLLVASLFQLIQLSIQIPVAVGFFALKRWAYGLYLWTIGPLILASLILRLTQPSLTQEVEKRLPLSLSMVFTAAWVAGLALLVIQVVLVVRSKRELVD